MQGVEPVAKRRSFKHGFVELAIYFDHANENSVILKLFRALDLLWQYVS